MSAALPAVGGAAVGAAGALAAGAAPLTFGLSILLPALLQFGPAMFNKLFGGEDPQKKLLRQTMALLSPENQARLQAKFYQQNISSPAYSQAQQTIAAGANNTANLVAQKMGASGIGSTGTGALLSSLTPSLVGSQVAGLRTAAYDQAGQAARGNIQSQIAALQGSQGPSQTQQYLGAGIEGFQPYLQAYLRSKGWMGATPTSSTTVAAAR